MNAYTLEDFLQTKRSFGASFSADAKSVAFLSDLSGVAQIYLVPREGGEPLQLTAYSEPIGDLAFSPTNNADLLFSMAEGGNERFRLYLLNLDSRSTERLTNNDAAIYRFGGWSYDGKLITYSSNERNGIDFDIFVLDIATRTSRCVFDQGGWCDAYGFSPDGTKVAILKRHSLLHNDLFIVELATNALELVTPHENHAAYGQPRWLPDSAGFFFINNEGREFLGVSFYDVKAKESKSILEFSWDVDSLTLSNDGDLLLVILDEEGYSRPKLYDARTLKKIPEINLPSGMTFDGRWSNDSQYLVFSRESETAAAGVWIWTRKEDTSYQVVT